MVAAESEPKTRILCVDDEAHVVDGIAVHLRRAGYEVTTCNRPLEAVSLLNQRGPFAVILSDMRMPEMNGAALLHHALSVAPDTVRLLLTGHTDMDAAVAAINDGQIFRFLTKPCPPPLLLSTIATAVAQHRLLTAERVLLEQTLHGAIRALTDVLAVVQPLAFGRGTRIKERSGRVAAQLGHPHPWQVELAAMLLPLGGIGLAPSTLEKLHHGAELDDDERAAIDRGPELVERLLGHIPRLEAVRAILRAATRPFRAADLESPDVEARYNWLGGHILRAVTDCDDLEVRGHEAALAVSALRNRAERYNPRVVETLAGLYGERRAEEIRELALAALRPGMVFAEDVKTRAGALLVPRGFAVTDSFVERIRIFGAGTIAEPVRMIVRLDPLER